MMQQDTRDESRSEIRRLVSMLGADPGFFMLSLHAYAEKVMNQRLGLDGPSRDGGTDQLSPTHSSPESYSFQEKIGMYRQYLLGTGGDNRALKLRGISRLSQMEASHRLLQGVLRRFQEVSVDEAKAETWSFLEFCRLSGIESPHLQKIRDNLDIWETRQSAEAEFNELRKARLALQMKDMEIKDLRRRADQAGSRGPGEAAAGEYEWLNSYRDELLRLSIFTRTRRDFEQSIVRLSRQQREAAADIAREHQLLIRGPAGSGKTVVLLESLRQQAAQNTLGFEEEPRLGLFTFARTLVKYDKYISEILGIQSEHMHIQTADSYIAGHLRKIQPGAEIRYGRFLPDALDVLISSLEDEAYGELFAILNQRQIVFEINEVIWGYALSREEYVDDMYSRRGLPGKLDGFHRSLLWRIQERLRDQLEEQQLYTRNLAALVLSSSLPAAASPGMSAGNSVGDDPVPEASDARAAAGNAGAGEAGPGPGPGSGPVGTARFHTLYIDEVQDLPPVVLRFFRGISARLIMAGDDRQSIYGLQSPFARAGIDIRGKSRYLSLNLRNSLPIQEFAELYMELSGFKSSEPGNGSDTQETPPPGFREGPPPVIHRFEDEMRITGALAERIRLYVDFLGYEPSNICILVHDRRRLDQLRRELPEMTGLELQSIRDPDFEFGVLPDPGQESSSALRISPIHSAKGLDFPVVLFHLPTLSTAEMLSREHELRQKRNLIYVGITRAMDHLEIFTTRTFLDSPEAEPLSRAWENLTRGRKRSSQG
ncbi:UvrD-helicase domain-containing protein [Salinispira pacifica]|uniref:DNA 3'-5' helicase n=1 Tax=Salinispira pacifica TaxID=1307761 RepID=V5WJM4_9SPIO|nr:UvrD-helicase domain-containing protein [Salinispira pacifica]AHC15973.1 hypothetical protein L21SP2_2621 [Salinispira pacifica]